MRLSLIFLVIWLAPAGVLLTVLLISLFRRGEAADKSQEPNAAAQPQATAEALDQDQDQDQQWEGDLLRHSGRHSAQRRKAIKN